MTVTAQLPTKLYPLHQSTPDRRGPAASGEGGEGTFVVAFITVVTLPSVAFPVSGISGRRLLCVEGFGSMQQD